ncbi:MAG: hypothetical protein AAF704_16280, partial [Cyanobacteria bacterium P01_D01_bin.123]
DGLDEIGPADSEITLPRARRPPNSCIRRDRAMLVGDDREIEWNGFLARASEMKGYEYGRIEGRLAFG